MSNSIIMDFEIVKTISAAQILATYDLPVVDANGNAYFLNPARMLYINNMTNGAIYVSTLGVNGINCDLFSIAANTAMILDLCTNKTVEQGAFVPEHTRIFVRERYAGAPPTTGDVDVTVMYGRDN